MVSLIVKEHLVLQEVFSILHKYTLNINSKKWIFLTDTISFLGFVISKRGIQADPLKIKAIKDWPIPSAIK